MKTPSITITNADMAKDRRRVRREAALAGPPQRATRIPSGKAYRRKAKYAGDYSV
jgi:hypothetical protein